MIERHPPARGPLIHDVEHIPVSHRNAAPRHSLAHRSRVGLLTLLTVLSWLTTGRGDAPVTGQPRNAAAPDRFSVVPPGGEVEFRPTPQEKDVPPHFQLKPHTFTYKSRPMLRHAGVNVYKVTFPSPVETRFPENNTVHGEYFQPEGPGPFPACVVLHILGGDFFLSETVANQLAQHGVAALFVKMPYYGERRAPGSKQRMLSRVPTETIEGMTQGVLDVRRAAAWLGSRPEVDPSRLGVTGISMGGIMSALSAEGEPRFKNIAVFLGGGGFADFIWTQAHPEAEEFRKTWIAKGGTKESFGELIGKIDPVTYGHLLKGRRVLMIAARNDDVITPANVRALWDSIGQEPEIVWLDAGHYTAIKYLPRELIRLDTFFRRSK